MPTVSVTEILIEYVPVGSEEDALTTPELLIVIPETVDESEAFTTLHVHDDCDPVPPLIVGVEVFAVPNEVEIPG
jgi:hypothetical protein